MTEDFEHRLRSKINDTISSLRSRRGKLIGRYGGRQAVDVELTLVDQGVDCTLKGIEADGLAATEALLDFARENSLARLSVDRGFGPETSWEPEPLTVGLGDIAVPFPHSSFLQPTVDGERALVADALDFLDGATTVADLFSGLGTFAFALAGSRKVLAVEAARDARWLRVTLAGPAT